VHDHGDDTDAPCEKGGMVHIQTCTRNAFVPPPHALAVCCCLLVVLFPPALARSSFPAQCPGDECSNWHSPPGRSPHLPGCCISPPSRLAHAHLTARHGWAARRELCCGALPSSLAVRTRTRAPQGGSCAAAHSPRPCGTHAHPRATGRELCCGALPSSLRYARAPVRHRAGAVLRRTPLVPAVRVHTHTRGGAYALRGTPHRT
jgi:hypothetical protein